MTDAEKQRTASEKEDLAKSAVFIDIESNVKTLEKKLSRHIDEAKPYFELPQTWKVGNVPWA